MISIDARTYIFMPIEEGGLKHVVTEGQEHAFFFTPCGLVGGELPELEDYSGDICPMCLQCVDHMEGRNIREK